MRVTATTTIRWLKMRNVKNCGKQIKGVGCPCAATLRRALLKNPKSGIDAINVRSTIDVLRNKYERCFDMSKTWLG
jgi:hypothetical protein